MTAAVVPPRVSGTLHGLVRFEGVLAMLLAAFPLGLMLADEQTRSSISAYHEMDDPKWFFVPLTAAAMMLIVNGLVRPGHHGYNAVLGVLLLGVVMFDHDGGSSAVHFGSAALFYFLSVVFIALQVTEYLKSGQGLGRPWSTPQQRWWAVGLFVAEAGLLVATYFVFGLFWAETVGLWLIAGHYVWHSSRHERQIVDDEPTDVFGRLWPRVYEFIVKLLLPLNWLWKKINGQPPPPRPSVPTSP